MMSIGTSILRLRQGWPRGERRARIQKSVRPTTVEEAAQLAPEWGRIETAHLRGHSLHAARPGRTNRLV